MTDADDNHKKNEIDTVTGVETTGHEWDGIKELDNPSPRWWLILFIITIIWSVGYWVVYPAWPTISGHTKGMLDWTSYKKLEHSQAEIVARQAIYKDSFAQADFDQIMQDPALYEFAVAGGRAAFKNNCATCHGTGADGGKGYPNLNDDDWLWGGTINDIYATIQYGIRSGHEKTRSSMMPSFGRDGVLQAKDITNVAAYVHALAKGDANESMPGHKIFADNCAACHGAKGEGGREVGAPRLSDDIWLYGRDSKAIYSSISSAHSGVMPFWQGRLDEETIRQLAIYVYSLGGGEVAPAPEAAPVADGAEEVQADEAKPANAGQ